MERGSRKNLGDFKQLISLNLIHKAQTIREMLCDYGSKTRNLLSKAREISFVNDIRKFIA